MFRLITSLFFAMLFTTSCVTNYGVAHRSYPSSKLPLPKADGKDTSAFYAGVTYSYGNEYFWQVTRSPFFWQPFQFRVSSLEDDHYNISLNSHYGYQNRNLYFGAGIIGYKGNYHLTSFPVDEIQGDLDFWGAGGTSEVGFTFQLGDFRLRPFGLKVTGIYEGGSFTDFKSNFLDTIIGTTSYTHENKDHVLFNVSGILGGSYAAGKWDLGLDFILGASDEDIALGITSYVGYKSLYLCMNYTTEYILGRYSMGGGLMYRF